MCKFLSLLTPHEFLNRNSIKKMSSLLFFFLFFFLLTHTNSNPLLKDGKTLAFFIKNLHSPLQAFDTWNISNPITVCSWSGITCSGDRVAALDLSNLNISGPADLAGLSNLRYLNISGNQFYGELKWNFSGLPNLEVLDAYDNNFRSSLPVGVADLRRLRYLDLGGNFFYGKIPRRYGELVGIESLSLTGNDLRGRIPGEIGNLTALNHLYLGYFNAFEGGIPAEVGNLRNLLHLDISNCGIGGAIPDQLGGLINLHTLFLHSNALSGAIPPALGNLTRLQYLDISNNDLSGEIPPEFSNLTRLRLFNLFMNRLHGSIPEFISAFPELETLELFTNNFTGVIPEPLGSGENLRLLDLSSNKLTGTIPNNLCPSNQLKVLILFNNFLFGQLPHNLGECLSLTRVRLSHNYFNGSIPIGLIYLPKLDLLELHNNYLSGTISQKSINSESKESILTVLNLSNNLLSGELPNSVQNLSFLETLILSSNRFSGEIPANIDGLRRANKVDFSRNDLSGEIPSGIQNCGLLSYIDFSLNNLSGEIPPEISEIKVLSYLNLSHNRLSGSIPRSIGSIASLTAGDFSFNNLSGELPNSGQLSFLNISSFAGNPKLCGEAINNPCNISSSSPTIKNSSFSRNLPAKSKLFFFAGILIISLIFAGTAAVKILRHRRAAAGGHWKMTSFQKVGFGVREVIESMKEGNEIGRGGNGKVYLGRSPCGDQIAIKKLMGFESNGQDHGFCAEIRTLGLIRHRNIVRLLAFCSDSRTNVLVYEYMSNGSLGEMLRGRNGGTLKWDRRYRIAIESARGLCYLHHDCYPMIIHRDVKSNNILLDTNLEAHVADFGLARFLLDGGGSESMSAVAGSYGYIAPEYAYTLKVDEKSDVYSFGVVLLELITGRRPVGEFGDGVDIVQWVKKTTDGGEKQNVDIILDTRLGSVPMDEAMHVFFVAILCIQENSVERPTMREVVQMLSEFARHVSSDEISASSSASKQLQHTNCYKLFPDLLS